MKKHLLMIAIATLAIACQNGDNVKIAQEFLDQFQAAANSGDGESAHKLYPTVVYRDSLFQFNPETMKVKSSKGSLTISDPSGCSIELVKAEDGTYQAAASHGFFCYREEWLNLAQKLGQYDPSLNDVQNSLRMNDSGFSSWVTYVLMKENANPLDLAYSTDRINSAMKKTITVTNKSGIEISGDDYIVAFRFVISDPGWVAPFNPPKSAPGVTIGPGESKTINIKYGMNELFRGASVRFNMGVGEMLSRFYTPTGKEYEEYVSANGKVLEQDSPDLPSGNYTFAGKSAKGAIRVNRGVLTSVFGVKGKTTGMGFRGELRENNVFTAYEYYDNGQETGYYIGKYEDGKLRGTFFPVSGSSYTFEFTVTKSE